MSSALKRSELAERLTAAEHELVRATAELPVAQRVAAQAHLDGEELGLRPGAIDVARSKIAKLEDVVAGLRQLHAIAEHREIAAELAKLRRQHSTRAREIERLKSEAERPLEPIAGVGSRFREAARAQREARHKAQSRYDFAHSAYLNEQHEIARLETRLNALESEFPDAVNAA